MGRFGEAKNYVSVSKVIQECALSIFVDDLAAIFKEHGSIGASSHCPTLDPICAFLHRKTFLAVPRNTAFLQQAIDKLAHFINLAGRQAVDLGDEYLFRDHDCKLPDDQWNGKVFRPKSAIINLN